MELIRQLWERKLVRFVVVGCFNTAFDTTMLVAIVKLFGWSPLAANCVSVSIAITVSYFLNHRIVFRETSAYSFQKYLRFFLVTGLGVILIQDLVIFVVTDKLWVISQARLFSLLGHPFHLKTAELVGAKLSAVLVGMVWNFLLYKYVVFHGQDKEDELFIG